MRATNEHNEKIANEFLGLLTSHIKGVKDLSIDDDGMMSIYVTSLRAVKAVMYDMLMCRAFQSVVPTTNYQGGFIVHCVPKNG